MKILIILSVIGGLVVLTSYYSILVRRCISVVSPLLSPRLKKLYESFVKWDESVSGTKRKAANKSVKNPDRYVEVENPYKKVSARLVGMVLAVLTLYINKMIGKFLLLLLATCLLCEIILFALRDKKESKICKVFFTLIPQIVIAIVLYILFADAIFH